MPQAPLMPLPQGAPQQLYTMQQRLQEMQKQVTAELQQQLEPQLQRRYVWSTPNGGVAYGRFGTASASRFWNSSQSRQEGPVLQQQSQQLLPPVATQQQQQSESSKDGQTPPPQTPLPSGGPPVDLLSSLMNDLEKEKGNTEGEAPDDGLPELLRPELLGDDPRAARSSDRQKDASPKKETPARQRLRRLGRNLASVAESEEKRFEDQDRKTSSTAERDLQGGFSWQQFIPSWTQFVPPQVFGRQNAEPAQETQGQRSNGMGSRTTQRDTAFEELLVRQQQLEQEMRDIQADREETDSEQSPNTLERQSEVGIQVEPSTAPKQADEKLSRNAAKLQALHQAQAAELKARQEERWSELLEQLKEENDELKQRQREQIQQLQEWQQQRAREQANQLSERQEEEWTALKKKQALDLQKIQRRQAALAARVQRDQTIQMQQLLAQQQQQLDQAERLHQLQDALKEQERDIAYQLQMIEKERHEHIEPLIANTGETRPTEEPETKEGDDSRLSFQEEATIYESTPEEKRGSGQEQGQTGEQNGETRDEESMTKEERESTETEEEVTPLWGTSESVASQEERINGITGEPKQPAKEQYASRDGSQQQEYPSLLPEDGVEGTGQGASGNIGNAVDGLFQGAELVRDEDSIAAYGDSSGLEKDDGEPEGPLSSSDATGVDSADRGDVPLHEQTEKRDEEPSEIKHELEVEQGADDSLHNFDKLQDSLPEDIKDLRFDQEAIEPSEQLLGVPYNEMVDAV
ncbi:putative glutamic acid-rich protein [Neospora caninum Liverpool]|uniref:Glutamic acid-rich protein, putative n=1 Tax=Neospora caninum (strain Liverpool) TaxID=572307 RepID=F0VH36_NEOCL|nr:putative glutamic acid-rich protein [Neospora caninum Liverpool]CBZ53030.1 putative glutamic acid-rich protein [Neospora caninum Liverpool]CEL67014.1 TPA: glutamic acid-rich protein, putative [Neospora caninum Liverpool]|eukprot:XP_003883062.1 putative glutamic acid-rich protein [Neospora caninum Liverpool]